MGVILLLRLLAIAFFVREDDFLNKRMTHNVLVAEAEDAYSLDIVQYLERIPDGLIPDKDRLIKEIRALEEAQKGELINETHQ